MSKVKMKALLEKGLAELCSYMKKYTAALGDLASATADGLDEKAGHHGGGVFYDSDDRLGEGFHPHQLLLL